MPRPPAAVRRPPLAVPCRLPAVLLRPQAVQRRLPAVQRQPLVVLLRTVKGRGVSFMEGRMEWHYLPLNDDTYASAVAELASGDPG